MGHAAYGVPFLCKSGRRLSNSAEHSHLSLLSRYLTYMQTEARLGEVRFLTVAEVATLMRVSKMTVYRLVHSGELTAVRVGRSFRVPEQAVQEYLRGAFEAAA